MIFILVFSIGIDFNQTQKLLHVVFPLCLPSKKLFHCFQGVIFIANKYCIFSVLGLYLKKTFICPLSRIVKFGLLLDIKVAILLRVLPIVAWILQVIRWFNPYWFFCDCNFFEKERVCSGATPILALANIARGKFI